MLPWSWWWRSLRSENIYSNKRWRWFMVRHVFPLTREDTLDHTSILAAHSHWPSVTREGVGSWRSSLDRWLPFQRLMDSSLCAQPSSHYWDKDNISCWDISVQITGLSKVGSCYLSPRERERVRERERMKKLYTWNNDCESSTLMEEWSRRRRQSGSEGTALWDDWLNIRGRQICNGAMSALFLKNSQLQRLSSMPQ